MKESGSKASSTSNTSFSKGRVMGKIVVVLLIGVLLILSVHAALATVPAAPVALQATDVTADGFTAHWVPSDGATGYRIDIAILDDFITRTFDLGIRDSLVPGGSTSSFVATGLSPTYTYYYRVRAVNDSAHSANSNYITVLHITTEVPLPSGTVGVPYTERLTAVGGTLPYTNWTVIGGSLPAGLLLDPATGIISGTATDTGRVDCTIQVTDNASVSFSKPFEVDVVETPTIALDTLVTRNNGSPTSSLTWSHPIRSGSNRMLIVSIGGEETGPITNLPITSVTYGGIPLTRAIFQDASSPQDTIPLESDRIEMWYLLQKDLPAPGSHTVLVTFTGTVNGAGAGSMSLMNVKQGPPEASASDSAGLKNKLTSYLEVPTDQSWLVGSAIVGYVGHFAPVDHQAERYQLDLNIADMLGVSKQIHEAGPDSMVVYHPLYNRMSQAVLSLAPAPAGIHLPITLASFTASVSMKASGIRLDWTTFTEINNYGFFVQRKTDEAAGYVELPESFVAGHGTTNQPQYYSFTDQPPAAGVYYYRLRQIDLDGSEHFSEAVQASVTTSVVEPAPIEFSLAQNYPNPFNPETEIKFAVETSGLTTIRLYNSIGQEVATLFNGLAEPGKYYKVRVNGSRLASGTYFYRLQSGTKSDLKKMLLLK
jgi:hypothetical protein